MKKLTAQAMITTEQIKAGRSELDRHNALTRKAVSLNDVAAADRACLSESANIYLDSLPTYKAEKLATKGPFNPFSPLPKDHPQHFKVVANGVTYYANTEGYDYCRYMMHLCGTGKAIAQIKTPAIIKEAWEKKPVARGNIGKEIECYDDNWKGYQQGLEELVATEYNDLNIPIRVNWSAESGRLEVYVLCPRKGYPQVWFAEGAKHAAFYEVLDKVMAFTGDKSLRYAVYGKDESELHFQIYKTYDVSCADEIRTYEGRG